MLASLTLLEHRTRYIGYYIPLAQAGSTSTRTVYSFRTQTAPGRTTVIHRDTRLQLCLVAEDGRALLHDVPALRQADVDESTMDEIC